MRLKFGLLECSAFTHNELDTLNGTLGINFDSTPALVGDVFESRHTRQSYRTHRRMAWQGHPAQHMAGKLMIIDLGFQHKFD